jgi:hypothetical protein
MRLVVLLTAVSLATAAAAIACSSAPPQAANSQDDTSADPSASASAAPAPAAPAAPAPAVTAVPAEAGTVIAIDPDAGAGVIPVGPVNTTPSTACIPGSIAETEPNDSIATANVIPATSGTFCGHVDPGNVDYVSFTMPQAVGNFGIGEFATGPISVQGFAAGQQFDFNSQNWPFIPGAVYTFQISSSSAFPADYRLQLTLQ